MEDPSVYVGDFRRRQGPAATTEGLSDRARLQ